MGRRRQRVVSDAYWRRQELQSRCMIACDKPPTHRVEDLRGKYGMRTRCARHAQRFANSEHYNVTPFGDREPVEVGTKLV